MSKERRQIPKNKVKTIFVAFISIYDEVKLKPFEMR